MYSMYTNVSNNTPYYTHISSYVIWSPPTHGDDWPHMSQNHQQNKKMFQLRYVCLHKSSICYIWYSQTNNEDEKEKWLK